MKFLGIVGCLFLSLSASAFASEYLDETYYRCGDASSAGTGNYSSLNHVQGPMDRKPNWNFTLSSRRHDPVTGYSSTLVQFCTIHEVVQVADGFEFKGDQCQVKVLQSGEQIASIGFNDAPAIGGCKWETDDSNIPYDQKSLSEALTHEGMPILNSLH